jgi:hypothetical protein
VPRGRPNLSTIVDRDDRRASLEAIRRRVAEELQEAVGRDVAVLAKELRDVIRELDSLPAVGRESPLDRIAGAVSDDLAKRRARRADAAGS